MNLYNSMSDNLNAIRVADGVTINARNDTDPSLFGVTMANGSSYVFPFGAERSPVPSMSHIVTTHLIWDNTVAFTAVVEECGFPARWPSDQAQGVADVADHITTTGRWILVRPPDAYVEVAGGGTYTVATGVIAVAAGQAGGCTITLSLWGGRRGRIRLIVTANGLVRCAINGKAAM